MDYLLFQKINSWAGRWNWLDALGIFSAKYLIFILVALVIFIFWRKRKVIIGTFLAAVLAKFVIVDLIRWIWPKARPFVENNVHLLINKINQSAFPSGHAAFAFALSAVVYFYNKKAGILFFVASFLIAVSRVFVGVHWPSDIVAGAGIGIFSGWLVIRIFKKKNLK